MSDTKRLEHIAEIEGLRGLSILLVVLFHLNEALVPGGFLGVDVFFVISGYLITAFIKQGVSTGTFSYSNFYMRRIRRLAPAMLATLLLCIIASAGLLSPSMMADFARSAIAALLSVSNFYFWLQVDYFDVAGHLKPLLHTWSLGVEEQFYLIWPFALVALILPNLRYAAWVLTAGIVVSVLGIALIAIPPETLFFLLPFRLFEFFVGAFPVLVNVQQSKAGVIWQRATQAAPLLYDIVCTGALIAVVGSAFLFDQDTAHPSILTLIPCIAAVVLITCAPKAKLGVLFNNPVMLFTGAISYSLYLVHWPVLVYYRHYTFGPTDQLVQLTLVEQVALLSIAFAVSSLMYFYVERPFRKRQKSGFNIPSARVLKYMTSLALVIVVLGASASTSDGWQWRVPEARKEAIALAVSLKESDEKNLYIRQNCIWPKPDVNAMQRLCLFGDTSSIGDVEKGQAVDRSRVTTVDYLLIGDSHAKAMLFGLDRYLRQQKQTAMLLMPFGRHPFAGVAGESGGSIRPPSEMIYPYIQQLSFKAAILVGRWSIYFNSGENKLPEGFTLHPIVQSDGQRRVDRESNVENSEVFLRGLTQTVDFFTKKNAEVIVIGEVPYMGTLTVECINVPGYLITQEDLNDRCAGAALPEIEQRLSPADNAFKAASTSLNFTYIPLMDLMCEGEKCERLYEGQSLYLDEDHLNALGSEYVTQRFIRPQLERVNAGTVGR